MKTANFIFVLLINTTFFDMTAQGCSDAGICTMGDFKPDQFLVLKYLPLKNL